MKRKIKKFMGDNSHKIFVGVIVAVIAGVILIFLTPLVTDLRAALGNGVSWLLPSTWNLLMLRIGVPVVVVVLLVAGWALAIYRLARAAMRPRLPNTVSIGAWVRIEPVAYQVESTFSLASTVNGFHAKGPFCSKCRAPADRRPNQYAWYDYKCLSSVCGLEIKLPDLPDRLKASAEATITAAWNSALLDGGEPYLDQTRWFDGSCVRGETS